MFAGLLYLILFLMILNVAPEATTPLFPIDPLPALGIGLLLYLPLLIRKNHIALVLYFVVFHFVLLAHRPYEESRTLFAAISIALYFAAYPSAKERRFIFPFVLPFIVYELMYDLLNLTFPQILNGDVTPVAEIALHTAATAGFLGLLLIFMPPIIQWLWGCKPIKHGYEETALRQLCRKLKFKHAGLKTWTVLPGATTAGIIGLIPQLRYILFTPSILSALSPSQIEAVLAHEIGHSQRRHLMFYPMIILGLIVISIILSVLFIDPVLNVFDVRGWYVAKPIALLVPLITITLLYLRYVFGYFSRVCERQADLHIFEANLHPESMTEALEIVGDMNGMDPDAPNWHHYNIRERQHFLRQAFLNPKLIDAHHRKVRFSIGVYLTSLALLSALALLPFLHEGVERLVLQWQASLTEWLL